VGLVLFVTLAGLVAAAAFARPISDSIIGLRNFALAIGRGEKEHLAPVSGPKELSDLALVLNNMAEDVRTREEALHESEEKFRSAFANAAIGFAMMRPDGRYVNANSAYCRVTGYDVDELLKMEFQRLIHPDDFAENMRLVDQMLIGRISDFTIENRYIRKGGEVVWVGKSVSLVRNAEGTPKWIITLIENITDRKGAEEALFASNRRLAALMNALPVGVSFSDDATCQRITGNPALLAQFEITLADNLSASAPKPNEAGRRVQYFREGRKIIDMDLPLQRAVAEKRQIPPMELEIHLPSGRRWFAEASGAPILDQSGTVVGGVAVTLDITERKRTEEALRTHRQLLETIIKHIPASVSLIRGSDLRLQLINPAYQAIAPGKEMEGKTLNELWPETGRDFTDLCRKVLQTGQPFEVQDQLNMIRRKPDGPIEQAYFSWSLFRVRLPGDEGW
jgi:PAS domain S-box-containing protein